jgi:hypothetical protein
MDMRDIIDVLASGVVWNSTGDPDAGSDLLAALHEQDYEFRLLAECMLAEGDERSLKLIVHALESGAISNIEAGRVLFAMRLHSVWGSGAMSFCAVGNA